NFINTIWNASRSVSMNIEGMTGEEIDLTGEKSVADRWILTRVNETIERVTERFDRVEFGEAGRQLYYFIWDDFCDWYIEMSKEGLYGDDAVSKQTTRSILVHTLDQILLLLHPIMPFVTEEIWEHIPHLGISVVVTVCPVILPVFDDETASKVMQVVKELI
ncbi:class I tRNA ligase family protein, partial [Enterococcus faecium]|uniref:class I tRNA ligase family protein n=1 Tax=Enterococcus faecium TaxID=1352 RepID=UPI0030C7A188